MFDGRIIIGRLAGRVSRTLDKLFDAFRSAGFRADVGRAALLSGPAILRANFSIASHWASTNVCPGSTSLGRYSPQTA